MFSDPIALLRQKLLPLFARDLANEPKEIGRCEIFGEQVEGYVVVDSYGTTFIQSDIVRIFTLPSLDTIGLSMGTWEAPKMAMRFTDYKGAYVVIPANQDKPELWCGGKYLEKINPKTPLVVRDYVGNNALIKLLEDTRPLLVISVNPRKELWLHNMLVGDQNHLVITTESGAINIPRKYWRDFKAYISNLDKKTRTEALVILRGLNEGRIQADSERVQSFYNKIPDFSMMCMKCLPLCPHAKNVWFSALGAV